MALLKRPPDKKIISSPPAKYPDGGESLHNGALKAQLPEKKINRFVRIALIGFGIFILLSGIINALSK